MGVKGLFQFLKRFEKPIHIPHFVAGQSVGIDVFWFLHQSKGDLFQLQNAMLQVIKYASQVHCVFDGTPSQEKKQLLEDQAQKRKEILQSIEQIEKFLKYPFNRLTNVDRHVIYDYLSQLKRQAWQPPPEYIDRVKSWLESKHCIIYQAHSEADNTLIDLENKGIITAIITNDSDLLILGSKKVLRPISPLRATLFDQKHICGILGFTEQQWEDFMFLCKNMRENDVLLAYSLISVYKDLDYGLQKYSILHNDCLVDNLPATF